MSTIATDGGLRIAFNGRTPSVHPTAFVAPNAVLIGDVVHARVSRTTAYCM